MAIPLTRIILSASLAAALAGCAQQTPLPPPVATPLPPPAQTPQHPVVASQPTAFANVDDYKRLAAEHIVRANEAHTFTGKLPGMLPAVVVLSITVDAAGTMTHVSVQRPPSRDDGESAIALASMRRTALLPKPFNLAIGPHGKLVFSETFLFNADMRFQLRTLAPIQTHED